MNRFFTSSTGSMFNFPDQGLFHSGSECWILNGAISAWLLVHWFYSFGDDQFCQLISLSIDWCLMQLSIWWEVGFLKSALKEIKICAESAVLVVVEIREINGWLGFLAIVYYRVASSCRRAIQCSQESIQPLKSKTLNKWQWLRRQI